MSDINQEPNPNIIKPRIIEKIKERPEERIDTKPPEVGLDGAGTDQDPRYYSLLKHFELDKVDPEQTEKLKTIWNWVISRSPSNSIDEAGLMLQRLQSELGVPPINMDRLEQVYQYVRLDEARGVTEEEVKHIKEKQSQLRS
jgi:hypothetical protein